jgi:hypothetical protein
MALSRKSQARRAAEAHSVAPAAMLAIEDAVGADRPRATDGENAEASMLQDIDAILSRIDNRIAKQRKEMDDLLERIRQPAA